jgi:hypothetical protein
LTLHESNENDLPFNYLISQSKTFSLIHEKGHDVTRY